MSFAYALKVLCDVAYYFTVISTLGVFWGQTGLVLGTPALAALCAYGCHFLGGKRPAWLRYLPLLGLPLMFLLTRSTADAVISAPVAAYVCWYAVKRPQAPAYHDVVTRFYLCLKLLPVTVVLAALGGSVQGIQNVVLPYFFMFLVLSVMLLRMLRHDAATIAQTRFQLINLAGIAGVGAAGWLLSSGLMLRIFRFIGTCILQFVVKPIFMGVIYIFAGFVWLLSLVFDGIEIDPNKLDLSQIGENMEMGDMKSLFGEGEGKAITESPIWDYVVIALAALAVLAIVFVLFRALAKHGSHEDENDFADVREALSDAEGEKHVNPRENRQRVRAVYRKFLKLCTQRGFELTEFQDSAEIEEGTRRLFGNPAQSRLRDVYVRARYSSGEISREDVEVARESYAKLKKNQM